MKQELDTILDRLPIQLTIKIVLIKDERLYDDYHQ